MIALRFFLDYNCQCSAQRCLNLAGIIFSLDRVSLPEAHLAHVYSLSQCSKVLGQWTSTMLSCLQDLSSINSFGLSPHSIGWATRVPRASRVQLQWRPRAMPLSVPLGSLSQSPGTFLLLTWIWRWALSAAPASNSVTVQPPKPPPVILLP